MPQCPVCFENVRDDENAAILNDERFILGHPECKEHYIPEVHDFDHDPSWYDEDDGQPDELTEWMDFDPDC